MSSEVFGELFLIDMTKRFKDLTEREILALAISLEEEDARIFGDFADGLRADYPATARVFEEMQAEESQHRASLFALYRERFGEPIPLIRRDDVSGFVRRRPLWLTRPLGIKAVRRQAELMEMETRQFYLKALQKVTDASTRKLLGDLEEAERKHQRTAGSMEEKHLDEHARASEDAGEQKLFLLQIIQPGLVGLMDGSVSTLAPVFAAAFATKNSWDAFLVGLAASVGAGISMGFAEALADDGKLSGRGTPMLRGAVCGLMTVAGGIGHTVPYLIPEFYTAMVVAFVVVVFELLAISYIQWRYMDTPPVSAAAKVMIGGALVLAAGILIGSS